MLVAVSLLLCIRCAGLMVLLGWVFLLPPGIGGFTRVKRRQRMSEVRNQSEAGGGGEKIQQGKRGEGGKRGVRRAHSGTRPRRMVTRKRWAGIGRQTSRPALRGAVQMPHRRQTTRTHRAKHGGVAYTTDRSIGEGFGSYDAIDCWQAMNKNTWVTPNTPTQPGQGTRVATPPPPPHCTAERTRNRQHCNG